MKYTDVLKLKKRAGIKDWLDGLVQNLPGKPNQMLDSVLLAGPKHKKTLKVVPGTKAVNLYFTGALGAGRGATQRALKSSGVPYQMFRHTQYDKAQTTLRDMLKANPNMKVNVFGHSLGARPASKLAEHFGNDKIKLVLQDPVSPFGLPQNISPIVYQPANKNAFSSNGFSLGNLAATVGGRVVPKTTKGSVKTWKGDHTAGAYQAVYKQMATNKDK